MFFSLWILIWQSLYSRSAIIPTCREKPCSDKWTYDIRYSLELFNIGICNITISSRILSRLTQVLTKVISGTDTWKLWHVWNPCVCACVCHFTLIINIKEKVVTESKEKVMHNASEIFMLNREFQLVTFPIFPIF